MNLLITAGPTREPIDAVRFISNRSSGRMGLAIAQAGVDAGCKVTMLLGPGVDDATLPKAVRVERFETTDDLLQLLNVHFPKADVLIMAAAVADYRPLQTTDEKIPRAETNLTLTMEPTPDVVATVAKQKRTAQRVVGFALESNKTLAGRARAKLARKGLDAIVANPLETMDSDAVDAMWIDASGQSESPGKMAKEKFGAWLVHKVSSDWDL